MHRDGPSRRDTLRCKPLKVKGESGSGGKNSLFFWSHSFVRLLLLPKPQYKKSHVCTRLETERWRPCVLAHKIRDNYYQHGWLWHDDAHIHAGPKQELENIHLSLFLVVSWTEWEKKDFKRRKMLFSLNWGDVFPQLESQLCEISVFALARGQEKCVLWASGLVNGHNAEYKKTKKSYVQLNRYNTT